MGTYADELVEREIRETGDRIMREHVRADELHGARPRVVGFALEAARELLTFADEAGLVASRPSPHHVQLRQDSKVFAEWWPSKGTTVSNGKRGPVCRTVAELIDWLKGL